MSEIIGDAIGVVIANTLPYSTSVNMSLGMAGGRLATYGMKKFNRFGQWAWSLLGLRYNVVKIYANEGGRLNPIYKKLEKFILEKHTERLYECNLAPLKGEVSIDLREAMFTKPVEIIYQDQKMWLSLSDEQTTVKDKDDGKRVTKTAKTIIVESRKLNIEQMKQFMTELAKLEKKQTNQLTVYRGVGLDLKKDSTPYWDELVFKSNKTMDNTIVSKSVEKQLYRDVDWFMNNESWYTQKGSFFS